MKKHFVSAMIVAATTAVGVFSAFAAADDPVLMTVGGKKIHVSEFDYLYNKNNSQQLQPETIDEYVEKFINYKLKVVDAEANGVDTTKAFIDEFSQYRRELAAPYMSDASVEEALVQEQYGHMLEDVFVSHIMIPFGRDPQEITAATERLDSIRTAILAGEITFEDAARQYSVDRNSSAAGGRMGYVVPGRFPWAFEKASYDTPVGGISPVINSGFGLHIIRPESRSANPGEVEASHLLRLTRGKTDEEAAAQKVLIDSLYAVLSAGADFAAIASQYSEDPGSARRGGELGWFGRGVMVQPFDSIAFAMPVNSLSEPFATSFGYHIIYKTGVRPVASLDESRTKIQNMIKGDDRAHKAERAKLEVYEQRYGSRVIPEGLQQVEALIEQNEGGYDSLMRVQLAKCNIPLVEVAGRTWCVSDVMDGVPVTASRRASNARNLIHTSARKFMEERTWDQARIDLADENPDYRNLINEYRDGILLFEISNRNVWDRAATDKAGLEKFFKANRKKYAWDAPKFKGYVVFASSDSVLNLALNYADSVYSADPTEFSKAMRERFGRDVKLERVIAAKGENAITDFLAFEAPKPDADKANTRWASYAAYRGRIIEQPEEAADVRGLVVTDYQTELENAWVKKLRKKYKHKLDSKVFKEVKEREAAKE